MANPPRSPVPRVRCHSAPVPKLFRTLDFQQPIQSLTLPVLLVLLHVLLLVLLFPPLTWLLLLLSLLTVPFLHRTWLLLLHLLLLSQSPNHLNSSCPILPPFLQRIQLILPLSLSPIQPLSLPVSLLRIIHCPRVNRFPRSLPNSLTTALVLGHLHEHGTQATRNCQLWAANTSRSSSQPHSAACLPKR